MRAGSLPALSCLLAEAVIVAVAAAPVPVPDQAVPIHAIRVDVALVVIPVNVTTPLGNPVINLARERFRLFEDGVEQSVRYFSAQDEPVSIGIVCDASGSMKKKMGHAREAIRGLARSSLPGDEFFLMSFNDRPHLLTGMLRSPEHLDEGLRRLRAGGWTALLDATALALDAVKQGSNSRKALILLSDGADNRSRLTELELQRNARESDVTIYAIGLFDEDGEDPPNIRLLTELTEETGGRLISVPSLKDLPGAVHEINTSIRTQYLLGYTPARAADGRYRKVRVDVAAPGSQQMRVSWRTGYYSPAPVN